MAQRISSQATGHVIDTVKIEVNKVTAANALANQLCDFATAAGEARTAFLAGNYALAYSKFPFHHISGRNLEEFINAFPAEPNT